MENATLLPEDEGSEANVNIIAWSVVHPVLMFLIIGGNVLTICAIRLSRKISALVSNQFVFSLALSDLMVGVTLPYHYSFLTDNGNRLGRNKSTCILRFVLIILACSSSIYNLLAIATDRYMAIVHPLRYGRYMTRRSAAWIITFGWTLAFAVATVPIYWNKWTHGSANESDPCSTTGENASSPVLDGARCKRCSLESILEDNYVNYVVTPMFISIWITMSLVYFRIWRVAVGHAKRIRTTAGFYHQNNNNNGGGNGGSGGGPSSGDSKSVQVVLLIMGCFSLCWMPFFIVMLYITATDRFTNKAIYESTFTLAITNSCMNPIIYAWKNTNFRRAFWSLLRCKSPNNNNHNHNRVSHKRSFVTNHVPTATKRTERRPDENSSTTLSTTCGSNGHCYTINGHPTVANGSSTNDIEMMMMMTQKKQKNDALEMTRNDDRATKGQQRRPDNITTIVEISRI